MPYAQQMGSPAAWEMLPIRRMHQDRAAAGELGDHHTAPLPPAQRSPKTQLSHEIAQHSLHKTVLCPENVTVHTSPQNRAKTTPLPYYITLST